MRNTRFLNMKKHVQNNTNRKSSLERSLETCEMAGVFFFDETSLGCFVRLIPFSVLW